MHVESIDVEVRDPPESRTPKRDALQTLPGAGGVEVTVHTNTGVSGNGSAGFGRIEGAPTALASVIENELVPVVVGTELSMVRETHSHMMAETEYHGSFGLSMFGISAIDTALWDCLGRELDTPCWKLWGGVHETVPTYATVGWLHQDVEELLSKCQKALDQGFNAVKMKVGADSLADDERRVKAVKDAVGEDVRIMVDANQSLSVAEAVRRGRVFEALDCEWFEEPIPAHDLDGYVTLNEKLDIPIATGENLYLQTEFGRFLRHDAVDIIQPDRRRAGGPTALLSIGQTANSLNKRYASHGSGPVNLNVIACLPNTYYLESGFVSEDSPMEVQDGEVNLPNGPGFSW